MNKIKTSVIGSYPIDIDRMDLMMDYFEQKESNWNKYIDTATNDMVKAGIDIISDGQTRDSFVNIFTRKLKGRRIRARTEIINKVEYNLPITVDDQKYIKKIIPKNKEIVGVITGPYTLTKSSINLFYNDTKELAFDFAYALAEEAKELQKSVDLISIDEPYFSVDFPGYGKDIISVITKNLKCSTRLHVCGDVSKIIPDILDMPVDIISHEFKASSKLFNEFGKYNVTKNICLGSVCSDNIRIETVDEIIKHLQKGIEAFGGKISQLAPDCGLRLLPRNIAFQKLKNLVTARDKFYGE